ncbi:phosphoribosyltransferase family protein [Enterococcus sp. BWR-S5]|uniref:phosphoribosyltransferase family protein n=1 Tax=Enterococcus sp. BWR-S5 TaxID=2787714 RepID=UPI0019225826|nr:phosphoribosyltransferase family protein [Enterococcus sp. BWR-S5]MBL1226641.1 phosphoribosyltransferase family protein [Enterococcus sp. BWR-S5]
MTQIREYPVAKGLKVKITIEENPFQIEPDRLFKMAARINKKRSFLFVSPVLGKHLPVNPSVSLLIGRALALIYSGQIDGYQKEIREVLNEQDAQKEFNIEQLKDAVVKLDRPITVIGFCETATALGQAFFESFASPARYIHTTREELADRQSILSFEEEHSHATAHRVYAADADFFNDDTEVILVDDEVTTGKTNLNIIRDIIRMYPQKKQFTIVSILDWRNEENQQAFRKLEQELDIQINEVSLLKGTVEEFGKVEELKEDSFITDREPSALMLQQPFKKMLPKLACSLPAVMKNEKVERPAYLTATGRFGLTETQYEEERLAQIGAQLKSLRQGGPTLVLGTGEFMYVPMRIASLMGEDVLFHTTTRSPILSRSQTGYPIFNKRAFPSPEQSGVTNYVYGIPKEDGYRDIFVVFERIADREGLHELNRTLKTIQDANIYFVDLTSRAVYRSVIGRSK